MSTMKPVRLVGSALRAGTLALGVILTAATLGIVAMVPVPAQAKDPICNWFTADWNQMHPSAHRAWNALGWTEERWRNNEAPSSATKSWKELSSSERRAAQALSFNQQNWDNETCE